MTHTMISLLSPRNKILVSGLIFSALISSAQTQSADSVMRRLDIAESPVAVMSETVYAMNPAVHASEYGFSLTDVNISYSTTDRDKDAYRVWEGSGLSVTSGNVSSFLKINDTLSAWGGASYASTHHTDIKWNSTLDYLRISPYILGDAVGGNLSTQKYSFAGGAGYSMKKWTIGAEASYRAEIAYRRRDPRVKDIVSDLDLKIGIARSFGKNWILGAGLEVTVYNQEADVVFYSPVNTIRTYLLTGLGSVYPRFSGGTTGTSAYEGTGFYGSLQIVRNTSRGLRFGIEGGKEKIDQRIREYNNLNLTENSTYRLRASALMPLSGVLAAHIAGGWYRRIGTENLFGTAVGNSYPVISSRQNYIADFAYGHMQIPVTVNAGRNWTLDIIPGFTGSYSRKFLRNPNRLLEYSGLEPALGISATGRFGKNVRLKLDVGYDKKISHAVESRLTGLDTDTELGHTILIDDILSGSDMETISAGLRCDFKIKTLPLLYIKASFMTSEYSATNAGIRNMEFAVGATF